MTPSDAQLIINDMFAVVVEVDGASDIACRAGFRLQSEPVVFSFGTGIVNNAQDFAQLYENVQGQVKVVTMINYCG